MASETTPLRSSIDVKDDNDSTSRPSCFPSDICRVAMFVVNWLVDTYVQNKFVLHIALAIVLAKFYPMFGTDILHPEITANWIAVMFIFTMAGLSLKVEELGNAATRIGFNMFVQLFNFGVVSAIVFATSRLLLSLSLISTGLADGMVICGCMPITITMVIVLTKSAGGDEAAAILNATFGNLLSVFLSPTLILFYIGVKADVDMASVYGKLILRVILPIVFGQLLRKCSAVVNDFVMKYKQHFKTCQEWALVFIVYTVFCKTFSNQNFEATLSDVAWMAIAQFTLLVLCKLLAWYVLTLLFHNDRRLCVMGLYGCTQKSLSMGIPLISAIYEDDPRLGLFTLPLLIWHPSQLIVGSGLAPRFLEWVGQQEAQDGSTTNQGKEEDGMDDGAIHDY